MVRKAMTGSAEAANRFAGGCKQAGSNRAAERVAKKPAHPLDVKSWLLSAKTPTALSQSSTVTPDDDESDQLVDLVENTPPGGRTPDADIPCGQPDSAAPSAGGFPEAAYLSVASKLLVAVTGSSEAAGEIAVTGPPEAARGTSRSVAPPVPLSWQDQVRKAEEELLGEATRRQMWCIQGHEHCKQGRVPEELGQKHLPDASQGQGEVRGMVEDRHHQGDLHGVRLHSPRGGERRCCHGCDIQLCAGLLDDGRCVEEMECDDEAMGVLVYAAGGARDL